MSQSPPHHLLGGVMLRDYAALLAETRRWPAGEQPPEAWMRRVRESAAEARRREGEAPAPAFKADLPVLARREEIGAAIRAHPVVVIAGETGSGKTTQLPQICLSLGRGVRGMIGHTQPRRLAARAVAARLADELGGAGERAVGYKIRFGDRTTASTMVKVMTDGVLLAETHDDPDLWAYDTIIIDEAHERSLNIDFLLGYLRRLSVRRPDLRIIVTSATIDPARFSEFFGGAPVLEVSGRAYPVEVRYRVPGHDDDETPEVDEQAVADAVEELTSPALPPGDVLVFLPGEREIRSCARTLERRLAGQDLELLPLFSRLSNEEQDRIFRPGKRRRVILATNVAETSLTVPGIRHVVDTGLARLDRYDPRARVQRLLVEPISQASCNQRSGRCGRQSAGVCIRLFSKSSFDRRARFTDPEIRRTNLASVILRMKALGLPPPGAATADEDEFPFLDRPEAPALRDGYATLFELGATPSLEPRAPLTTLGERLARIPADPRTARILLAGADEGCLREALILAAGMSVQDPRERPQGRQPQADAAHEVFRHPGSDFLTLLNMWDQYEHQAEAGTHGALRDWCRAASLSAARMREWQEVLQQLRRLCGELGLRETGAAPASEDAVHRAMLTGLLGNVCCRAGEGGSFEYAGPRGARVSIFPGSVLFKKAPKWIVAAEIVETTRLYARTVGRIEPEWIEELGGHVLTVAHSDEHYDAQAGAAMAWERVTLSGVVVVPRRKAPLARTNPALARRLFIERALASGELVSDAPFAIHNRALLAGAQSAEARVRTRNLLAPLGERAAWFEARLPAEVYDAASLEAWLARTPAAEHEALRLSQADVLSEKAAGALDEARYPATLALARGRPALALEYRFEPGKEADGITASVALTDLPAIDADRAAWLVPGWLPEIVHALLKHLPREHRDRLDSPPVGPLPKAAAEIAGLVSFGAGALPAALSEAAEVLTGARVPLEAWRLSAVPDYLRLRLRVVDDHGKEIASERDIAALQTRLAARAQRAIAAALRSAFERENVTEWDFPDPPEEISVEQEGGAAALYPAVLDMGGSVTLTLLEESGPARAATALGVRRLFALAARDELHARLDSLAAWPDLVRWHNALGTTEELREAMCALICERAFLSGEQPPRTREAFEAIRERHWGRLSQATMEAAEMVAKILEPRAKVAHRLSGGTSRNWAASVADMREHAAYLMPRGFLGRLPWERLREYPRYAEGLRARLFRLREEGSPAETQALAVFLPNWKRFTAWVVQAISREKALSEASPPGSKQAKVTRGKAPLPQSRRAAPTVNLDAGEWALTPGILPPAVAGYRWALEEYRLVLFAPDLAGKGVTQKQIDELWGRVSGT